MTIYLYVKTHNKTGLKYLGQTSQKDPHEYPGSGTRWIHHLNKHGYDYSTEIIKECQTKEELKKWGIYYSNLWNVVFSKEWANLKSEEGDGGSLTKEIRDKIRKSLSGKTQSIEHREKNSKAHIGSNNIMFGKTHTEAAKKKISENRKSRPSPTTGKIYSAEERDKIRQSIKSLAKIKCRHCGAIASPNNHKRWHDDSCKFRNVNLEPDQ